MTESTGGHALTLSLMAQLSSSRGWDAHRLWAEWQRAGLAGMRLTRYRRVFSILEEVENVLELHSLTREQETLLRLMAAAGGSGTMAELSPLLADVAEDENTLARYMALLRQTPDKCPQGPLWAMALYTETQAMIVRDFEAAKRCLAEADNLVDTCWPGHPELCFSRDVAEGVLHLAEGDPSDAVPLLENALAAMRSSPACNPFTVSALETHLSEALFLIGETERGLEISRKQFPNPEAMERPDTLNDMANLQSLAILLLRSGQPEKARKVSDRVAKNLRRFPDMNPVDQAGVRFVRANIYLALGSRKTALRNLQRADTLIRDILPEDDPYRVRIRETIASMEEEDNEITDDN